MKISSHDGSPHRQQRLEKVRKLATHLLRLTDKQFEQLVEEIHDFKGNLEVTWLHGLPNEHQRDSFGVAWELVGEDKRCVSHALIGEEF